MGITELISDPKTVEYLIQLTITFFGVFLGFELSKWQDKSRDKSKQKEIKRSTIESLIIELDENEPSMKKAIIGEIDSLNPHTLFTGAFKTSISSGNFYLFNSTTQKNLQSLYSKIDELKVQSGIMFTLVTPNLLAKGTPNESQVKTIIQGVLLNAEKNRISALDALATVRKNLQEEQTGLQ